MADFVERWSRKEKIRLLDKVTLHRTGEQVQYEVIHIYPGEVAQYQLRSKTGYQFFCSQEEILDVVHKNGIRVKGSLK